jgi:hypothetical protein
MAYRIELDINFRGKYDLRVGDLSGASEHYNASHQDVIQEISEILEELARKHNDEKSTKKGCGNDCECDCHILVGGSGKLCPECVKEDRKVTE